MKTLFKMVRSRYIYFVTCKSITYHLQLILFMTNSNRSSLNLKKIYHLMTSDSGTFPINFPSDIYFFACLFLVNRQHTCYEYKMDIEMLERSIEFIIARLYFCFILFYFILFYFILFYFI